MDKFILFSMARSGSTTLFRAFGLRPQVRGIDEPFNRDCHPQPHAGINNSDDINNVLETLWQDYNALKHVAGPTGWPFRSKRLNFDLLRESNVNTIVLYRQNLLRRAMSVEIAQQIGVWHPWDQTYRNKLDQSEITSISIDVLRERIRCDAEFAADVQTAAGERRGRTLITTYEELYESGHQLEFFNRVADFVGFQPFGEDDSPSLLKILDPRLSITATNSLRLYTRVPNVMEIEEKLGSDAHGWLFAH